MPLGKDEEGNMVRPDKLHQHHRGLESTSFGGRYRNDIRFLDGGADLTVSIFDTKGKPRSSLPGKDKR